MSPKQQAYLNFIVYIALGIVLGLNNISINNWLFWFILGCLIAVQINTFSYVSRIFDDIMTDLINQLRFYGKNSPMKPKNDA